jgi:hypothetical protein
MVKTLEYGVVCGVWCGGVCLTMLSYGRPSIIRVSLTHSTTLRFKEKVFDKKKGDLVNTLLNFIRRERAGE